MVRGDVPTHTQVGPLEEPLCAWIPAIVPPGTPCMTEVARRAICERILLKQDDAWAELIQASAAPQQ
jgi:hypothetical protein